MPDVYAFYQINGKTLIQRLSHTLPALRAQFYYMQMKLIFSISYAFDSLLQMRLVVCGCVCV